MNSKEIRVRPAAYAWILDEDRVLLCRLCEEHNKGQWTLPGGGLDPGEHPEAACLREVKEETGLEVSLTHLLGVDSITFDGVLGPMQHLRIFYLAQVVSGTLTAETDGTTDLVQWIRLEDLATLNLVDLVRRVEAAFHIGRIPLSPKSHG